MKNTFFLCLCKKYIHIYICMYILLVPLFEAEMCMCWGTRWAQQDLAILLHRLRPALCVFP